MNEENRLIFTILQLAGTHSHSGVAGFIENLLPTLTTGGFVPETFNAIIDGIMVAMAMAHSNMALGALKVNSGTLVEAAVNRSPTAYVLNPEEERALYEHDTDKDFTQLAFFDQAGKSRALINWYAVHGTSLYENNTLVSGDNKGYAAWATEDYYNNGAMPATGDFVAAFSQASVGDTSPNTEGNEYIN